MNSGRHEMQQNNRSTVHESLPSHLPPEQRYALACRVVDEAIANEHSTLDFSDWNLDRLPSRLAQCPALRYLMLDANPSAVALPTTLEALRVIGDKCALEILDLTANGLEATPELCNALRAIGEKRALETLRLGGNRLEATPEICDALRLIGEKGAIKDLSLGDNLLEATRGLCDALRVIGEKGALWNLELHHNELVANPWLCDALRVIGEKCSLDNLDLSSNMLEATSEFGAALRVVGKKGALRFLTLWDNPLGVDLDGMNATQTAAIIDRLVAFSRNELLPWREIKVAIIGDGEVGKSVLRARLAHEPGESLSRKAIHTRNWERRVLEFPVPVERMRPRTKGIAASSEPVRAHLVDFGGQNFLWGTHRLFMGVRRSMYVVVARADKPFEQEGNRVSHWLKMLEAMRNEAIEAEVRRRELKMRSDFAANTDRARRLDDEPTFNEARERKEIEGSIPYPPVVVVITHVRTLADRQPSDYQEGLAYLNHTLASFAQRFGRIVPIEVDIGLNDSRAPIDAETVRAAINAIINTSTAFNMLWEMGESPTAHRLIRAIAHRFAATDPTVPWITDREYKEDVAAAKSANDEAIALEYLPLFRDLGIIHWVGDASWQRRFHGSRVAKLIFNSDWVREPVYSILWDQIEGQTGTARCARWAIRKCLERVKAVGSDDSIPFADRVDLLLELMEECDLIFRCGPDNPKQPIDDIEYLIPEKLPDPEPNRGDGGYDHITQWRPSTLNDYIMPQLIVRLVKGKDAGTRRSLPLIGERESNGVLVQLDGTLRLRLHGGDEAARAEIRGRVVAAIEELLPRVEPEELSVAVDATTRADKSPGQMLIAAARHWCGVCHPGIAQTPVRRFEILIEKIVGDPPPPKVRVSLAILGAYWWLQSAEASGLPKVNRKIARSCMEWLWELPGGRFDVEESQSKADRPHSRRTVAESGTEERLRAIQEAGGGTTRDADERLHTALVFFAGKLRGDGFSLCRPPAISNSADATGECRAKDESPVEAAVTGFLKAFVDSRAKRILDSQG